LALEGYKGIIWSGIIYYQLFNAGMKPQDILKTATVNAADLIGKRESLGTIEIGKIADIIAMHGSPLTDIKELLDVDFVMKSGTIVKQQ